MRVSSVLNYVAEEYCIDSKMKNKEDEMKRAKCERNNRCEYRRDEGKLDKRDGSTTGK